MRMVTHQIQAWLIYFDKYLSAVDFMFLYFMQGGHKSAMAKVKQIANERAWAILSCVTEPCISPTEFTVLLKEQPCSSHQKIYVHLE